MLDEATLQRFESMLNMTPSNILDMNKDFAIENINSIMKTYIDDLQEIYPHLTEETHKHMKELTETRMLMSKQPVWVGWMDFFYLRRESSFPVLL